MGKRVSNKRGKRGNRRYQFLRLGRVNKRILEQLRFARGQLRQAHKAGDLPEGIDFLEELKGFKTTISNWVSRNSRRFIPKRRRSPSYDSPPQAPSPSGTSAS